MIYVASNHPPIVVGLAGGELARYHAFTMSFSSLHVPLGSKGYGGLGYDVSYNRNSIIRFALQNPEIEYVQMWDDDHVFPPDTTIRLLDQNVDVVVPLYAQRQPPFNPCIYKSENEDGSFNGYGWVDLEGKEGLLPVSSAGAGGLLVRRRVLEAITEPWFERQGLIGEDHLFFRKVRAAGFTPYVALDVPLGHLTIIEVYPSRAEWNDTWSWFAKLRLGIKDWVEWKHERYR